MAGIRQLRARFRGGRESGITLAEIVVVIAIAVAFAALAVPALRSTDLIGPEVRRVIADVVRTRNLARTSWETTRVRFDLGNAQWICEMSDGTPIQGPTAAPSGWRELDNGVRFGSVNGVATDFTFLPNGRGLEPAAVRVFYGNDEWRVELDSLSGRVSAAPQ